MRSDRTQGRRDTHIDTDIDTESKWVRATSICERSASKAGAWSTPTVSVTVLSRPATNAAAQSLQESRTIEIEQTRPQPKLPVPASLFDVGTVHQRTAVDGRSAADRS